MSEITTIVLAGGERDQVCRDAPDAINKAFVSVGGIPLVSRVLRALRESRRVGRVIVVAPEAAPKQPLSLADVLRPSGPRIGDSLRSGLEQLPDDEPVLICASDLPLLRSDGIDDFLEKAVLSSCDLGYGFLERQRHEARYPQLPHTWARLRDGVFCGTGISIIRPRALTALLQVLEQVGAARKAPWRLASLLGPFMLAKYSLGILSIADIEKRAGEVLQYQARGIRTLYPELAVNIDRFEDLARVENILLGVPAMFSQWPKHW